MGYAFGKDVSGWVKFAEFPINTKLPPPANSQPPPPNFILFQKNANLSS